MRMLSPVRSAGRARIATLAAALGTWVLMGSSAKSDDGPFGDVSPHGQAGLDFGTLGWASYGYYPGFYGFSLRYHLGYGYGEGALGAGADGGYPFYGGPGYCHPGPPLQRCGPIAPFAYYSGPGHPYNFALPGPLVVDQPVAMQTQGGDAAHAAGSAVYPYDVGFGPFTGAYPYPESFFAPFTAAAAASGSSAGPTSRAASTPANADPVHILGIDEESVVDTRGMRGMKVWRVYPGSPAETAGLKPGDAIRSINGYRTEQPGNVAWIIANATPDKVLKINVQAAAEGAERTITAQIP
jgi:membrane-associated protease RseP (regulator of RpoE activity)